MSAGFMIFSSFFGPFFAYVDGDRIVSVAFLASKASTLAILAATAPFFAAAIVAWRGKIEVTATSRVGAAQTSDAVGAVGVAGAIADRFGVDFFSLLSIIFGIGAGDFSYYINNSHLGTS
ncbi:unnamed protein product [Trifolium pratense]|uniref:Uncharacterized protein n=1 Tax=Trifolium pratense TaxID=57577 RepID=A0ACB0IN86_TRIPR|nr:unnamed protein product [Trifolium pratense]